MHRAIFLAAFLLGWITPVESLIAESNAGPTASAHFQELWNRLRSDIQSAEVKFRVYFGVTPQTTCDEAQLNQLIDQHELSTSISRVPDFLRAFAGPSAKLTAPARLHQQDGDQTRQQFGESTYIEDADYFLIRRDNNRQISAYFRGGSTIGLPRLTDIRKVPRAGFEPQSITRTGDTAVMVHESVSARDAKTQIRSEYQCDWVSGIPVQIRLSIQGRLSSEVRVFNLMQAEGSVAFPQSVLEITYDREQTPPQVKSLNLYVVDDARFNIAIPSEAFVMSKPVGTEVLDRRFPDSFQALGVAKQEVSDIRQILPSASRAMPAFAVPEWSMRRRLFFFMNGIMLLALSVWLWRRALRTS